MTRKKDILDLDDLLEDIEKLDTPKIADINQYIKTEIPYYISKITHGKDFMRGRPEYYGTKPRNCRKFLTLADDNEYLQDFHDEVMEFYDVLFKISQRQRTGVFVYLSKCNKSDASLNARTWADTLRSSFHFELREVNELLSLLESEKIFYSDEDNSRATLRASKRFHDMLLNILDIIEDDSDKHDFVLNLNFSLLDE